MARRDGHITRESDPTTNTDPGSDPPMTAAATLTNHAVTALASATTRRPISERQGCTPLCRTQPWSGWWVPGGMVGMVDPRMVRTREHVLSVCRAMLAAQRSAGLTFTAVAARSEVSRATLYRHWETAEAMLVDAVTADPVEGSLVSDQMKATTGSVYRFLRGVREDLTDPSKTAAVSGLIAQAVRHDPSGWAVPAAGRSLPG